MDRWDEQGDDDAAGPEFEVLNRELMDGERNKVLAYHADLEDFFAWHVIRRNTALTIIKGDGPYPNYRLALWLGPGWKERTEAVSFGDQAYKTFAALFRKFPWHYYEWNDWALDRREPPKGEPDAEPERKERRARPLRDVPLKVRFTVLERHGFRCAYCSRSAPEVVLHVDHIVPVAKGGSNDPDNLVAACSECNIGKGARILGAA